MAAAYKQSDLYAHLNSSLPPVQKIEHALAAMPPGDLSALLTNEPETVFIIDYYFRLFPKELAARLISHPDFSVDAAVELYNCQIIRHFRASLEKKLTDESYASIAGSYWGLVGKEKLLEILRHQFTGKHSAYFSVLMLLQKLDASLLNALARDERIRSKATLEFFKAMGGGVRGVITSNLDMYDFLYKLARDLKDGEYTTFLDDYTRLVVQLRIAETVIQDLEQSRDASGHVRLKALLDTLPSIPEEARRIALEMMRDRGLIDDATLKSVLELEETAGDA